MCSRKYLQHGSTLIEVLIALLIFSITTAAATAMLLESLRSLNDTINQQRAARLASNLQAILTDLPADVLDISSASDSAGHGDCAAAIRCTPADWLAMEFRRLQDQAKKSLPSGRIELAEGRSGVAIRVSWASQNSDKRLTYALQHEAV